MAKTIIKTDLHLQKVNFETLTRSFVAENPSKTPPSRFEFSIKSHAKLWVRVTKRKKSIVSYGQKNSVTGKRKLYTVGDADTGITISEAANIISNVLSAESEQKTIRPLEKLVQAYKRFLPFYLDRGDKNGNPHRAPQKIGYSFQNHILPRIGDMIVSDIKEFHITNMVDAIIVGHSTGINERAKGGQDPAKQALSYIRQFFKWYCKRNNLTVNPVANLSKEDFALKKQERDRKLSREEVSLFFAAVDNATRMSPVGRIGLKLQLLLCNRVGELLKAEWKEIDFDKSVWSVPQEHTKTYMPHRRPLPKQALDMFKQLYLLTSHTGKVLGGINITTMSQALRRWQKPNKKGDRRLALEENLTIHDLRRSAITFISEIGADEGVQRELLSHAITGTLSVYNRDDKFLERKDALQKYADALEDPLNLLINREFLRAA